MKNLILYSHGGSGNHGCEAIVRGTAEIFQGISLTLYSNSTKQDKKYGIARVASLVDARQTVSRYNPGILDQRSIRLLGRRLPGNRKDRQRVQRCRRKQNTGRC